MHTSWRWDIASFLREVFLSTIAVRTLSLSRAPRQALHSLCLDSQRAAPPKLAVSQMPMLDVSAAAYLARADCPMRSSSPMACFAHVRGLGSPAASHTQATCSGPREPGVAAARRGRFECPRRALAPRLPPPPELRGACGRAACAPRLSARRLSSVSRAARVPPNPQVSERARKARRAR